MALIVQKFGGTSVGTIDRIHHVAKRIVAAKENGHQVVVVVSAMSGETDRLIRLATAVTPSPDPREYDVLISTGEQVSMSLLSIALNATGYSTRSFTGSQIGILTDAAHTKARILDVRTDTILRELEKNNIVVIAGFQGVNEHQDITTLGRGGSDTTAVAIAAALRADECHIYTDVDGVYTTDPHLLPDAKLLKQISFEEMLEMASLGAKVLQMRSVELAHRSGMPIRVLSSFSESLGTLVTFEEKIMENEKRLVSGVAFSREEAVISLSGIPRKLGLEGLILEEISNANIDIDMIAQNTTAHETVDFTFTVHRREYATALALTEKLSKNLGAVSINTNAKVAKLSLVGVGMRSHTGVASTMFKALGNSSIPIQMITTSEIRISVIIDEAQLTLAVRAVHDAFELDKEIPEKQRTMIE